MKAKPNTRPERGWRVRRLLTSLVIRQIASPARREKQRAAAERKRIREKRPHRVFYFHQLDDPYSCLTAQILGELARRFEIELAPQLAGSPDRISAPEPEMLAAYARLDAGRIAPFYGVAFSDPGGPPSAACLEPARRILAAQEPEGFIACAAEVSAALWAGDEARMKALAEKHGSVPAQKARDREEEGTRLRREMGHYLGAVFAYEGECYWGLDRLPYLEKRLADLGARRAGAPAGPVAERKLKAPASIPGKAIMRLEYFSSLRSPYSYLAHAEAMALPEKYPVELTVRPVLPMVMRGLPVSRAKGVYIFRDVKREAETRGLPFAEKFLDPIGPPVRRGYSLFPFVAAKGKGGEFLGILLRGAFSEGRDIYAPKVLREIFEKLGLSFEEARAHLDDPAWEEEVEANRLALAGAGCWGVPSFRLIGPGSEPEFALWGQDRLWLLREEIARRAAQN